MLTDGRRRGLRGRRRDALTSLVHEAYEHGHRAAGGDEGDAATIARCWRALNGR